MYVKGFEYLLFNLSFKISGEFKKVKICELRGYNWLLWKLLKWMNIR